MLSHKMRWMPSLSFHEDITSKSQMHRTISWPEWIISLTWVRHNQLHMQTILLPLLAARERCEEVSIQIKFFSFLKIYLFSFFRETQLHVTTACLGRCGVDGPGEHPWGIGLRNGAVRSRKGGKWGDCWAGLSVCDGVMENPHFLEGIDFKGDVNGQTGQGG